MFGHVVGVLHDARPDRCCTGTATAASSGATGTSCCSASLVGVGTGLHVAAQVISHEAHVDATFAVMSVAMPVLAFEFMLFALYTFLVKQFDPFHVWLFIGAVVVLALSVVAVGSACRSAGRFSIVAASPLVIVVGYETVGHRHQAAVLERNGVWRRCARREARRHPLVCYRDRMFANLTTWWPAR